ncbi:MAG TPA: dTDP-4-dehydrorhamnose 3,5-epimerase [Chryseolinea sp.]|nr:dTDP-4-dehydrorhamnose 3,5-epimerase [Chryseolinea sp.]
MKIIPTGIDQLVEIIPYELEDNRGWFVELFKEDFFKANNLNYTFVQDNKSFSKKGVVRGLHMQLDPHAQAKLVSVIQGKVLDVVVDLRKGSKTFSEVYYCVLDGSRHNMLLVPPGFAHGFAAMEDSIFFYKCSNHYNKDSEIGLIWNDPQLNIDWQLSHPIISEKDMQLPTMAELLGKSVISRN